MHIKTLVIRIIQNLVGLMLPVYPIVISAQSSIIDFVRTDLQSPDKKISVQFYQRKDEKGLRTMYYLANFKNKTVINESVLDIQLDNHLSERAMVLKVDLHARDAIKVVVPLHMPGVIL